MRLRSCAAAVAVLALGTALPQAQRQAATFRLVVEAPRRAKYDLQRAAKDGFTCATVARPVPPFLPNNVTVLLTRPAGPAPAAPAFEVVTARGAAPDGFQDALNKVAATGYGLCGVTLTQPEYDPSNLATFVGVMAKVEGPPPEYRVLHTRLQPGEWEPLQQSAAGGFLVTHVLPRPQRAGADTGEMLLVAEKAAATPPSAYALVFAETADALQNALKGRATGGYRPRAIWAGSARLNVLMARPLAGAEAGSPDYRVDERAQLRLTAMDGELVGLVRRGGGVVTVHDATRRSESTITRGELADTRQRPILTVKSETQFVDRLDSDGGRGYRPFEVTLRPGQGDQALAEVILLRPPAP